MSEEFSENITWTRRLEMFFSDTAEKAMSLSWCHKESHALYDTRRTYIDLPVIILSGVTGFLSVGTQSIFGNYDREAQIGLGLLSLFVATLNTVGSYFGWSKRSEAHKICSLHYARLSRFIAIQLGLPRNERMTPTDLLAQCRDQQERLNETSPLLPEITKAKFKQKFSKVEGVTFPEELNGIDPITVYNEQDLDKSDTLGMNKILSDDSIYVMPDKSTHSIDELFHKKGLSTRRLSQVYTPEDITSKNEASDIVQVNVVPEDILQSHKNLEAQKEKDRMNVHAFIEKITK